MLSLEHRNGGEIDIVCSDNGQVSDGFHTMHELYQHRLALNVALFNSLQEWQEQEGYPVEIVKSKLHNDGTMFEGYFIVVLNLYQDNGYKQISYHYDLKYWDKFKVPEIDKVPWEYDGHTSQDVIERLLKL